MLEIMVMHYGDAAYQPMQKVIFQRKLGDEEEGAVVFSRVFK